MANRPPAPVAHAFAGSRTLSGFYGWKLLLALSSIVAVNLGVTFVGANVINAAMAKSLHLGRGTLGLGSTVYIIINGLAAPLVARVIAARGARLSLAIGSLLVALGASLLALWVSTGWQFVWPAQMPFSNAVSAAAPFLVGVVYDLHGSYTPAFYAVAGFSAFAALMLLATSAPAHRVRHAT